jgi:hypothetical protein
MSRFAQPKEVVNGFADALNAKNTDSIGPGRKNPLQPVGKVVKLSMAHVAA